VQLLRHQADGRAGGAVILHDVVAIGGDGAAGGIGHAANQADERGLARAVGAEQGKNLTTPDVEIHVLECLKAPGVGFAHTAHTDDGVGTAGW